MSPDLGSAALRSFGASVRRRSTGRRYHQGSGRRCWQDIGSSTMISRTGLSRCSIANLERFSARNIRGLKDSLGPLVSSGAIKRGLCCPTMGCPFWLHPTTFGTARSGN